MSKYVEKIDDIFQALYGGSFDEEGNKYSEYYNYEVKSMETDFYEYIELFKKMPFTTTVDDVVRLIVLIEFEHIGNTRYSSEIDYVKLKEIAEYLLSNK